MPKVEYTELWELKNDPESTIDDAIYDNTTRKCTFEGTIKAYCELSDSTKRKRSIDEQYFTQSVRFECEPHKIRIITHPEHGRWLALQYTKEITNKQFKGYGYNWGIIRHPPQPTLTGLEKPQIVIKRRKYYEFMGTRVRLKAEY